MKTVVLQEPGRLVLSDGPAPAPPASDEALVRVRRIGVCGTDFHALRGDQPFFAYPRILGHELGVELLQAPANPAGLRAGDRCAVEPYLECGRCVACRRGRTNCCVELRVLGVHVDGGMREMITLPLRKLHRSDSLSFEQLALVEPLSVGAHAVGRAGLEAGETVLVVGTGPIGLSVIAFARSAGARVIAADVSEGRREFCRRHLGVETALAADGEMETALRAATGGEMPTVVFEATGNAASMERSFGLVAGSGKLVLVGLCQGRIAFSDPELHRREMTVLSSRNAVGADFERVLSAVEAGRVDVRPWITHRAPLSEVSEALPSWGRPETAALKPMVEV
ncbi:MAG: alcohol dehydrogenase [Acidobacteria bacterium]|nr:MAG: alcohol dehydrogenase [Acidobacteriota bacterium]PYQ21945.1 MAG: alcohol dehydrogenase [Acidobacteriota bacterium]